jgi:hypothetical protein
MDIGEHPPTELRLSYRELADRLSISVEAARQIVRRRGWQRIVPNRLGAAAMVVVPIADLDAENWRQDRPTPQDNPPTTPDVPPDAADFRTALDAIREAHASETETLREQMTEARQRADRAEAGLAGERQRADRAEARADQERLRADELRTSLEAVRADLLTVEDAARTGRVEREAAMAEAERLRQVEAERQGRGRLARTWAAWRGR